MNILMTSDLAGLGGGETSLINLVDEFRKNNNVYVICAVEGTLVEILREKGIKVYVIDYRNKKSLVKSMFKIRGILKKEKIQVIHSNDPLTSIIFYYAAIGLRVQNFWTCHGQWYHFSLVKRKLVMHVNQAVFCVSSKVQESLSKMGFKKTIVSYLGIPIDEYEKAESAHIREQLGIERSVFLIGEVGRFQKIKGQLKLVKAIELLKQEETEIDIKCLLIGGCVYNTIEEQEYYSNVISYIKDHDMENVIFLLGERKDVPSLMKDLDLLVVPSDNESFGMVAIEAMACGTSLVSTPNDGVSETLEYCDQLIAKTNDEYGLKDIIFNYISSSTARHIGHEIIKRKKYDYDIETVANRYLKVLGKNLHV